MKYISNITQDAVTLPADVKSGYFTVTSDPSKVADGGIVKQRFVTILTLIKELADTEKLSAIEALGIQSLSKKLSEITLDDIPADKEKAWRDALGITQVLVDGIPTLANILIGNVENDQRARLRSALQLTDDSQVVKGYLADDRSKFVYYGGNLYGVRRLLYNDLTSTNQRPGYEGTNEARPLNGTGNSNFDNASNQYYTMFFASRNVFSIKLRHTNNNWANRSLAINYSIKNLTASSGSYTYNFLPASGWLSVSRLQFKDDGGNTSLDDLQVLYADSDSPTLMDGQKLIPGDFFKINGTQQTLRFEGLDTSSGAWKASPVSNNLQVDSALNEISTNAIQNRAVYAAIEELKRKVDDFLTSEKDVEEPRIVLLDMIPDVTIAGNQEVVFRVYIDD